MDLNSCKWFVSNWWGASTTIIVGVAITYIIGSLITTSFEWKTFFIMLITTAVITTPVVYISNYYQNNPFESAKVKRGTLDDHINNSK